jgi:hypothetical protein
MKIQTKFKMLIMGILTLLSSSLFAQPSNDYIGNSLIMNSCGGIFSASNAGATDAYSSSQPGCGTYQNNFDCNNSTGNNGSGTEVSYTIENDIWYYFCPGVNGTWTITVDQVSCSTNNGYQIWVGQGTPTNLHTEFYENGCGNPGCASGVKGALTFDINVIDYTQGCVYIGVDGYAGTTCTFQISINTTTCTLLQSGNIKLKYENNILQWDSFIENISGIFTIEYSEDLENWETIKVMNNYGIKSYYSVIENREGYYKINYNDIYESNVVYVKKRNRVLDVKYLNTLGQEIDIENYKGIFFIIMTYDNERRTVEKKIKI